MKTMTIFLVTWLAAVAVHADDQQQAKKRIPRDQRVQGFDPYGNPVKGCEWVYEKRKSCSKSARERAKKLAAQARRNQEAADHKQRLAEARRYREQIKAIVKDDREWRTWGGGVKAQFVRKRGDRIVLRPVVGDEFEISAQELNIDDRQYLKGLPSMEAKLIAELSADLS